MKWYLPLLVCALAPAASVPRISYSKSFPGSVPAYVGITLDKTGACEYKESPNDDDPLKFQLKATEVTEIFSLASKLGNFTRPLEAHLKVAFTGIKTFSYQDGAQRAEVKFNFTQNPDARTLSDWFERISESEQQLINLERAAKYDKLGVLSALLQLEMVWDRKRLVSPDQFLPMLDRIAKNESYMHTARLRAAHIADEIRASDAK